jgi:hypothetical protein
MPGTGRLFTMVPTNTAHPDHLILFTEVGEIQTMFRRAGWFPALEAVSSAGASASQDPRVSEVHIGIFGRAA